MANAVDLKENKTLFVQCGCRSEILTIEYDYTIGIAELAIYEHYMSWRHKMSLWQRLRYCWRVLWYKKPYADQMVIEKEQLLELKRFVDELGLVSA